MVAKSNYVCFDCRLVTRAVKHLRGLPCPKCGHLTYDLTYRYRVPKRTNHKAWKKLRTRFFEKRHLAAQRQWKWDNHLRARGIIH